MIKEINIMKYKIEYKMAKVKWMGSMVFVIACLVTMSDSFRETLSDTLGDTLGWYFEWYFEWGCEWYVDWDSVLPWVIV